MSKVKVLPDLGFRKERKSWHRLGAKLSQATTVHRAMCLLGRFLSKSRFKEWTAGGYVPGTTIPTNLHWVKVPPEGSMTYTPGVVSRFLPPVLAAYFGGLLQENPNLVDSTAVYYVTVPGEQFIMITRVPDPSLPETRCLELRIVNRDRVLPPVFD